jgi:hypothetical protein
MFIRSQAAFRRPTIWVFLGPSPFAAKALAYEGWIVLDFLGFSRQDLDLSMGYVAFWDNNFLSAFSLTLEAREWESRPYHVETHKFSFVHLKLISNFLQRIVAYSALGAFNQFVGFGRRADLQRLRRE